MTARARLGKTVDTVTQASLSLIAVGGALLGLYTFYDAITADLVIMEPLRVPAAFESKGYSGEIATQRLLDVIAQLNSFSTSAKDRKYYGDQALFDTIAKSEVTIAGVDIKAIRAAIQKATGREPKRISGEVALTSVGGKDAFTVRLRSNPPRRLLVDIAVEGDPGKVLERTALALLEQLDPVIAASISRLRGDPASALRLVDAALTNEDPGDDRPAITERSFVNAQLRRFDEARADALQAQALEPTSPAPLYALANLHRETENYAESMAAIDKAIVLAPRNPQGYLMKARTLLRMKRGDEAIAVLRENIPAFPTFWPYHQFLGIALTEKGDLDGAKLAYARSIALAPQFSFVHFALGEIEAKQGNMRAALSSYREAYALAPGNPMYLIALVEAEVHGGSQTAVAPLAAALRAALAEERVPQRAVSRAHAALKGVAAN